MTRQQPRSMTHLGRALLALVGLGALAALLTVVLRDDLVDAWAADNEVRLEGLAADTITPPAFVPVAITLFVVLGGLLLLFHVFVRAGHGWARPALSALVAGLVLGTVAVLRTGLPTVFVVLSVVALLLEAAVLFFLWQRDTTAYVRGTWVDAHRDASHTS